MRELSVTDVQRVLREHANIGHDVLQHPQHVVVQDKPYRMRVASGLYMSRDPDDERHYLNSDLMLSERPLLSTIQTILPDKELSVMAKVPTRDIRRTSLSSPLSADYFGHFRGDTSSVMSYDLVDEYPNQAKSAHEALEAHVNIPLEHMGMEHLPSGDTMHHEQMGGFNPPFNLSAALTEDTRFHPKPFSGLIHVMLHPKPPVYHFEHYHYDPHSEKLTRVDTRHG